MDGISLSPVRGKPRHLAPGWYVARHRKSVPGTRWSLVAVYHLQEGDSTKIAVFQIGSVKPEALKDWEFRLRVLGIEQIPDRPKPHPKIEKAEVLPILQGERRARLAS